MIKYFIEISNNYKSRYYYDFDYESVYTVYDKERAYLFTSSQEALYVIGQIHRLMPDSDITLLKLIV